MIYWIFLACAIAAEIIGTLSMKYASLSGSPLGHMVMYSMIALSYLLLSFAIKRVAIGRGLCIVGRYWYYLYHVV